MCEIVTVPTVFFRWRRVIARVIGVYYPRTARKLLVFNVQLAYPNISYQLGTGPKLKDRVRSDQL